MVEYTFLEMCLHCKDLTNVFSNLLKLMDTDLLYVLTVSQSTVPVPTSALALSVPASVEDDFKKDLLSWI